MELTVLGCSGSYGAPAGGACSGYLVRAGDADIWMDCGNGTFANLQQHANPADLTAVVITHAHRRPLRRHLRPARDVPLRPRAQRPARVHARRASSKMLEGSSAIGDTFDWQLVGDGDRATIGDAQLRFSRTDHPPPTVAVEIAHDGKRLVYTADTGPEWSVDAFGAGADLVLSEATYLHDDIRAPIHLSARQAGEAAREAKARAADDHPFVADARPGSLRRRGLGGVRARGVARRAAPHHARLTAISAAMTERVTTRASGRRADDLRPVTFTRDFTEMADGSVLVEFGRTRVLCTASLEEPRAAVAEGLGQGLGHRRVLDAAGLVARARRPRSVAGQAERPHAGDPAADRPLAARRHRPAADARRADHRRLRRAAGRRRHAHRVDLRRLDRAARRVQPARRQRARSPGIRCCSRAPRSRSASSTARRCSTSSTPKTCAPRST